MKLDVKNYLFRCTSCGHEATLTGSISPTPLQVARWHPCCEEPDYLGVEASPERVKLKGQGMNRVVEGETPIFELRMSEIRELGNLWVEEQRIGGIGLQLVRADMSENVLSEFCQWVETKLESYAND